MQTLGFWWAAAGPVLGYAFTLVCCGFLAFEIGHSLGYRKGYDDSTSKKSPDPGRLP